jgi:hypothetical protein
LSALIRALAVDNACSAITSLNPGAFTDNSTGVAAAGFTSINLAPTVYNAAGAAGAPVAGLNTALGDLASAHAVLASRVNSTRTRLGLTDLTTANGTVATPGTVPALVKTLVGTTGTGCVSYASYVATMTALQTNQSILIVALQEVEAALGQALTASTVPLVLPRSYALAAAPVGVASTGTGNSVAATDGAAALTRLAANVATFAAKWNAVLTAIASTSRPLGVVAADI